MLGVIKKYFVLIVALAISVGGYFVYLNKTNIDFDRVNKSFYSNTGLDVQRAHRKLDGGLTSSNKENLLPIAVMIENHTDARPPAGLSAASLVYEALSEGDITRFLAIFDGSKNLEKIGPVRSARPYYIDLAGEYGALYVHCGGSPQAIEQLLGDKRVTDLNQFYRDQYFWRSGDRFAPHNLYTSSSLLLAAKKDYQLKDGGDYRPWKFKDGGFSTTTAQEIKIFYSSTPNYQVVWKYNLQHNYYERWQNNSPHQNEDGAQIIAKNVIVQVAATKLIDDYGRREINLAGKGAAIIFLDGKIINGSWQKNNNRTLFYDQDGREIEFNRGQIWIEIVPGKNYYRAL